LRLPLSPTKTTEFKAKMCAKEAKAEHTVVILLIFEVIKRIQR